MADQEDRSLEEGLSQPQRGTESESDNSAEVQLLVKTHPTLVLPLESTEIVTSRGIKPIVSSARIMDAGIFADSALDPIYPTNWDEGPTVATCPKCDTTAATVTQVRLSRTTCFFTGFVCVASGICLLALLCPCCKDVEHFCRNCGTRLGGRAAV